MSEVENPDPPAVRIAHAGRYGALDLFQLAQFEAWLGEGLPPEYREFLLACNGGVPEPAGFDAGSVDCFFALHDQVWDSETPGGHHARPLVSLAIEWTDLEPDRLDIPVGQDADGRWITLVLSGPDRGVVWLVDLESDDEPLVLAPDFQAFLNSLR